MSVPVKKILGIHVPDFWKGFGNFVAVCSVIGTMIGIAVSHTRQNDSILYKIQTLDDGQKEIKSSVTDVKVSVASVDCKVDNLAVQVAEQRGEQKARVYAQKPKTAASSDTAYYDPRRDLSFITHYETH